MSGNCCACHIEWCRENRAKKKEQRKRMKALLKGEYNFGKNALRAKTKIKRRLVKRLKDGYDGPVNGRYVFKKARNDLKVPAKIEHALIGDGQIDGGVGY